MNKTYGKIVIALAGPAKSGKGEVAAYLDNHGFNTVRNADYFKQVLAGYIGVPVADLNRPETKEKYRALMQYFGSEVLRDMHLKFPEFPETPHARLLARQIAGFGGGRYVIEDCRFADELKVFRDMRDQGWVVACWGLRRPVHGLDGEGAKHRSETEAEAILASPLLDQVIDNDGSLTDLYGKVDELLKATIEPQVIARDAIVKLNQDIAMQDKSIRQTIFNEAITRLYTAREEAQRG